MYGNQLRKYQLWTPVSALDLGLSYLSSKFESSKVVVTIQGTGDEVCPYQHEPIVSDSLRNHLKNVEVHRHNSELGGKRHKQYFRGKAPSIQKDFLVYFRYL